MAVTSGAQMGRNIALVLQAGRLGLPLDMERAGIKLVGALKVELSKPGTGRLYLTRFFTDSRGKVHPYGIRPPHQASAPGEPPAPDTGRLRASYSHHVVTEPTEITLSVGSGLNYASLLEFGTSRMKPRPHLRPVIAAGTEGVRQEVADGIEGRERAMARRLGGRG